MFRISIDIGGTFTDLIAMGKAESFINIKVPTVPKNPEVGVLEALKKILEDHDPKDIKIVTHATTITTNALFGQIDLDLPKSALITTKGFRDVLEIGRQKRPELYNLFFQRLSPLVPRRFRYEIRERIDPEGKELEPLNFEDLKEVLRNIKREKIQVAAIGLLNSYANPVHEHEVKRAIEEECPGVFVTNSCEISPEYREYERISTAVVNVVLIPIVKAYIENLVNLMKKLGFSTSFYVMQSSGGLARARDVIFKPATIIESGPASGVVASAFYGNLIGLGNVLSFDMGGTTAKTGVVRGNLPEIVGGYEVGGRIHGGRVVKESGYPIRFPIIDLAECSAGGGTIAWIDEGGALKIGPKSVGAHPGPACYKSGNMKPTITDANLVLGRLNPKHLLGGRMKIYIDLACESLRSTICKQLDLELSEAASSIVKIANSIMAKILRIVSVERGYDPRSFSLIAFGGAGPMHAYSIAQELNIPQIIVPITPGLFSAMGLLVSDVVHNYLKAVMKSLDEVSPSYLEALFNELEEKGRKTLEEDGFTSKRMMFIQELDARYKGQSYELSISAPQSFTKETFNQILYLFSKKHRTMYGYSTLEEPVELVNVRLKAIGIMAKPKLRIYPKTKQEPSKGSILEMRDVFFEDIDDYTKCPVFVRERLEPGNTVDGPAIIEQYDSTTVISPQWKAEVDEFKNLRMTQCREDG